MQSDKSVTLIGAGLVGSLLSIYLARRGHKVEIYERRSDMRNGRVAGGRSINLAISTRGLSALNEVQLKDKVMKICLPMKGRMVHSLNGVTALQPYSTEGECINSVSRLELNKLLMTEAEEKYGVKIHFDRPLTDLNLDTMTTNFNTTSDVFIGTDGSASVVRESIIKKTGGTLSSEELSYAYKELIIPAGPSGEFLMEPQALHIWPRGNFMLIALPNLDKSFTATLFLSQDHFKKLNSPQELRLFFKDYFPDALNMLPHLDSEFFEHPTGHMVTIKAGPWSYQDKALILGDAAHAIVPFFGQGMNCGFEDCRILDQILEKQGSFEDFFNARKENADAIADLAQENFIEMRDKVADGEFLFQKAIEKILAKNFPQDYISRYQLVSFSNIPYKAAQKIGLIEDGILKVLAQGLKKPEDVDVKKAKDLIEKNLRPELSKYIHRKNELWI